ncbi:MAG TPA: Fic/DOC family N-terminal domain-containing protein, partial [Caulobacteraceae bacterium]|nr:Fic/DOC family N-terminal domain-containing protein [Caulobacteraceae bacterium]
MTPTHANIWSGVDIGSGTTPQLFLGLASFATAAELPSVGFSRCEPSPRQSHRTLFWVQLADSDFILWPENAIQSRPTDLRLMNAEEFHDSPSGRTALTLDGVVAFVPNPLPPSELSLGGLVAQIARATQALGELSGIGRTLPNPYLLLRPFMRKEAVASSKIEGTVTSLSELLIYEAGSDVGVTSDTVEVRNYITAIEQGIRRLEELPVSSRLILELHKILMSGVDV